MQCLAVSSEGHPVCPHCGSNRVAGHGHFTLMNGTSRHRHLCRNCGRSFCQTTKSPLHYLKKSHLWNHLTREMSRGITVRRCAALLGVSVATAFHWRHRLLSALGTEPLPVLLGAVAVGETYVRYSEKGRRPRPEFSAIISADQGRCVMRPIRRFIDRKPSCVLLACSATEHVMKIVGRGRPTTVQIETGLKPLLGDGVEVWAVGFGPYTETCRHLGVPYRDAGVPTAFGKLSHPQLSIGKLARQLYGWLWLFRGVATRYLDNYLAWHRYAYSRARVHLAAAG